MQQDAALGKADFGMNGSTSPVQDNADTSTPWTGVAGAVALVVAFRIPAFLEPHWYSDESIYAYVGRTVFGGGDLYTSPGAWDNKPPLQYWIYGVLTHFLGYSEAAIHLVPFASAVAAVVAVGWGVARLTGSKRRGVIACVLAALVIGPPIFDSELFLPEAALIGPMTWAGMLMLVHITSTTWAARHRWAPYVAGLLASIALGMQQTVIADIVAIGLIVLIACPSHWRDVLRFLGTGLVVSSLWLLPTVFASGLGASWFAIVGFYGIYAHNALPPTVLDRVVHFAAIAGGALAIFGGSALLGRRTRNAFWMLWILAGIDLLVAGAAHFPYPHLLLPSIPWICAALAATPWQRASVLADRVRGRRLRVGVGVLAAGVALASALGSYAGSYWLNGRSLSNYYVDGYAGLVNSTERIQWQDGFSGSVVLDAAVSNWLIAHHYAHASAVVWNTADVWVYLDTPLTTVLPSADLFNNDVLLGNRTETGPFVARHRPTVIVLNQPAAALRPSILPVLARYYVAVYRIGPDTIFIERSQLGAVTARAPLRRAVNDRSGL
jgi:4-amino-4-deoxy-L-arabinose transferase-like glycosyltransferase